MMRKEQEDERFAFMGDTNILLWLTRGSAISRYLLAQYQLFTSEERPIISYVSVAEIRVISEFSQWGSAKYNQLNFVLSQFRVVHINEPNVLETYIKIDIFSRKHGIEMGKNDLWIAATASMNKATLLTTDKDFDHLDPAFLTRIWIDPTLGKQTPDGSSANDSSNSYSNNNS